MRYGINQKLDLETVLRKNITDDQKTLESFDEDTQERVVAAYYNSEEEMLWELINDNGSEFSELIINILASPYVYKDEDKPKKFERIGKFIFQYMLKQSKIEINSYISKLHYEMKSEKELDDEDFDPTFDDNAKNIVGINLPANEGEEAKTAL